MDNELTAMLHDPETFFQNINIILQLQFLSCLFGKNLDQEVSPVAVQKQLRHKHFNTTQIYNRSETARALVGAY